MRRQFLVLSVLTLVVIDGIATAWKPILWTLILVKPMILFGLYDTYLNTATIQQNFSIVGRGRSMIEALHPEFYQYFIESDIDGPPINLVFRSVVYQRAKREVDTVPFDTEFDVDRSGYEHIHHSVHAFDTQKVDHDLWVKVGSKNCGQP